MQAFLLLQSTQFKIVKANPCHIIVQRHRFLCTFLQYFFVVIDELSPTRWTLSVH